MADKKKKKGLLAQAMEDHARGTRIIKSKLRKANKPIGELETVKKGQKFAKKAIGTTTQIPKGIRNVVREHERMKKLGTQVDVIQGKKPKKKKKKSVLRTLLDRFPFRPKK